MKKVDSIVPGIPKRGIRPRRIESQATHYTPAEKSLGGDAKHTREATRRQFAAWG